jgi:hypothetical protein
LYSAASALLRQRYCFYNVVDQLIILVMHPPPDHNVSISKQIAYTTTGFHQMTLRPYPNGPSLVVLIIIIIV